jgi:hypothetical protein
MGLKIEEAFSKSGSLLSFVNSRLVHGWHRNSAWSTSNGNEVGIARMATRGLTFSFG